MAQIQGAPKSNIKKKVDAWPTVYLWIGKFETKKSNGFLERKVAYVTIYIFKKIKKNLKKNGGRLKNSLKKWPIFPLFFGSIKYYILVKYNFTKFIIFTKIVFFGLIVVNCHTGHINKQNPARFFKIGSVVPEIICQPFKKKAFREKRV